MTLTNHHASVTRTAEAHVADEPPVRTATGARPILPFRIEVSYRYDDPGEVWVRINGRKVNERGEMTDPHGRVERTYAPGLHSSRAQPLTALPDWAAAYVTEQAPPPWADWACPR